MMYLSIEFLLVLNYFVERYLDILDERSPMGRDFAEFIPIHRGSTGGAALL